MLLGPYLKFQMLMVRPSEFDILVGRMVGQLESDGLRRVDVARTKIQMVRFDGCVA